jgi:hypothetical protein
LKQTARLAAAVVCAQASFLSSFNGTVGLG